VDTFDAGALVLFASDNTWAKLAFELSPQKQPMLVSVVTKEHSDDVNHLEVNPTGLHMRIAGLGKSAYAFHYSMDGHGWSLARFFDLPSKAPVSVGFSSQSPMGSGLLATFKDVLYEERFLEDIRSGL
jgi:regulation of enolase protein 1 (concanavalin A-like superfamily)